MTGPVIPVIVQARMSSTRLPGKVMMPFAGTTFLESCLDRCSRIAGRSEVVVATVDQPDCDALAELAAARGYRVFRGALDDVLSRYVGAARMVGAQAVMRITSDCPLIDPDVALAVKERYLKGDVDLATTNIPPSWPNGLDVEIFSMEALEEAHANAATRSEREHVSTYIRSRPQRFRLANLPCPNEGCAQWRMTLDTPQDMTFLTTLADRYTGDIAQATWSDLHAFVTQHPELLELNTNERL